tara:strand:- start:1028 stop:1825 length:798 start_codon:yes stop_codon:yes gene_type:complete
MISIEEIKLLIEKLEKVDKNDLQKLLDQNLKLLKGFALAVDAYNQEEIQRLDKTVKWFRLDLEQKRNRPVVDDLLYRQIVTTIYKFARTDRFNSLEIGPGTGMFSKDLRAWKNNFYLDVLPEVEDKIRRRFKPKHQKYLKFFTTDKTDCAEIPNNSCNFVFSWDTFVFFTQEHIKQYLKDINRVLIDGSYCMINYADCHYDYDLNEAKRGYWNYNTKTAMENMIKEEGYEVIEMKQFRPGANYAVFQKPGNANPVIYKDSEISLD